MPRHQDQLSTNLQPISVGLVVELTARERTTAFWSQHLVVVDLNIYPYILHMLKYFTAMIHLLKDHMNN